MIKQNTMGLIAGAAFAFSAFFTTASAQQSNIQTSYSATAVHEIPGHPETRGTVIKSGENMRLEFEQNGQQVIQILRPEIGAMYILDPQAKTYVELAGPDVPPTSGQNNAVPCNEQSGLAVCQRVGRDTISGINVERWLLAVQPDMQPNVILWDPTRRHALRQEFPDGISSALNFVAMEDINGRRTERWALKISAPGQEVLTGGWWFDAQIRVVVREELPGGEVRRLEDIDVGPIDPAMFQVPEGWTKHDIADVQVPQAPVITSD